ncbi:hypothetical protein CR513_44077, partial [Mucuna pruriens]
MENNDQMLKELATPDMFNIERPLQALKRISCGLFHDEAIGDTESYIKMKAFLFSLDGAAKDWLYLQPVLFNTLGDMKCMFLENFFPASRIATIKKKSMGLGNILERHYTNSGKDLTSYVPLVHIIRSASNC